MRLIGDGEDKISSSSQYTTEMQSFKEIQVLGGFENNQPKQFKITTNDDIVYYYGQTADSKIEAGNAVAAWLLNKMQDRWGNYIEYEYIESLDGFYISKISYTGNSSNNLLPYNIVQFNYNDTGDETIQYIAGIQQKQVKILNNISIYCEGSLAKKYQFQYSKDFYTHLMKIFEYGSDNKSYRPIELTWGVAKPNAEISYNNNQELHSYYMNSGDYNADGFSDYVRIPKYFNTAAGSKIELFINNKNEGFDKTSEIDFEDYISQGEQAQEYQPRNSISSSIDWDGDGKSEFYYQKRIYNSQGDFTYAIPKIVKAENNVLSLRIEPWEVNICPSTILPCDVNGDGKTELFIIGERSNECYLYGIDFPITPPGLIPELNPAAYYKVTAPFNSAQLNMNGVAEPRYYYKKFDVLDFNGDGRSDIMIREYGQATKIYEYNILTRTFDLLVTTTMLSNRNFLIPGDFNADGKTDFFSCYFNPSPDRLDEYTDYQILYSNGKDNFNYGQSPICCFSPADNSEDNDNYYQVLDANGDGKDDLLRIKNNSDGTSKTIIVAYSKGNFTFEYETINYTNTQLPIPILSCMSIGDYNGDGQSDFFIDGYANSNNLILKFHPKENKHMVHQIIDGLRNYTNINYNLCTDADIYSKSAVNVTYPLVQLTAPIKVVGSISTQYNTINYFYKGLKIHKWGKGILGFEKFIQTDTKQGIKSEQTFEVLTPYYINLLKTEQAFIHPSNVLINTNTYTNQVYTTNYPTNKQIFVWQPTKILYDAVKNITTTETMSYYDITTGRVGYINTDINGQGYKKTTMSYDNTHWSKYVRKFPIEISNEYKYDYAGINNPIIIDKETFVINPNNGSLGSKKSFSNLAKNIVISYTYDSFGNILSESNTINTGLSNAETRTNSFTFDAKGRFLLTQKNALNHISYFNIYDIKIGKPLQTVDINGLITSYTYDGFGREKTKTLPTGQVITTEREWAFPWCINCCLECAGINGKYFIKESSTGTQAYNISYYQSNGKTAREIKTGFAVELIYTDYYYNTKGQLEKVSAPYTDNDLIDENFDFLYKKYTYDDFGRVKTESFPDENPLYTINNTYAGLTTSITKTGNQIGYITEIKSATSDARGLTIASTDNGGSITFTYDSKGQPKTTNANGIIVTIEFDAYGNQTKLTDPNAGVTVYDYDAWGQLIYQKDGNGNVIENFTYDKLGRILSKREKSSPTALIPFNYTYTYDTQPFGKGQPTSSSISCINTNFNSTQTFEYDNFCRTKKISETTAGNTLVTQIEYDILGRVTKNIYPSGFATINEYNAKGYLSKIKRVDNNALIWQANSVNKRDQTTQYQLGNGKVTDNVYTVYGFPQSTNTASIYTQAWDFNPTNGDLRSRSNSITSATLSETFTYDNTNRLNITKLNNIQTNDVNYATNGNINYKSNMGTYIYSTSKLNAVTSISPVASLALPIAQNITYSTFNKALQLSQGTEKLVYTYGADQERRMAQYYNNNILYRTKLYTQNYEDITDIVSGVSSNRKLHYIFGNDDLVAIYEIKGTATNMYYTYTDYLGSIVAITNSTGNIIESRNYDAWGLLRNPSTWAASNLLPSTYTITDRGYTGHEMLPKFGLINMNGRLYDPQVGRMLSPDNYIQSPSLSQNFNRYSYCLNNPLKYTDPSGNIIDPVSLGIIAGVIIGAYVGGSSANGTLNFTKWDLNSGRTWGYMLAGAAIGGFSGGIGGFISSSGVAFANTSGIVFSSFANSIGMAALTGGDVGFSFGAGSYNFGTGELGYLGKKGNSALENVGFGLGAMANIQDIFAGTNGGSIDVKSRKKLAGHSWIEQDDINISVGPAVELKPGAHGIKWELPYLFKTVEGENFYTSVTDPSKVFTTKLYNVNLNKLQKMTNFLNKGLSLNGKHILRYGVYNGCVNQTSRALLRSGVLNVNALLPVTSPVFLNAELALRNYGMMFSYYFNRDYP